VKRVLVCGGRNLKDEPWVYTALASCIRPWDLVITGGAAGADTIAHDFAVGMGCPTLVFPADWQKHGRSAGPIRNRAMLSEGKPDLVLAFPGGAGTDDMVKRARGGTVEVIRVLRPGGEAGE
jgi:YspA, cpYpsA-related SLOG family